MVISRHGRQWAITPLGGGLGSEADVDPEVWTVLHPGMWSRFLTWSEQAAEFLMDLRHVSEWVQFPVDALESSGSLGVFSEPAAAILLQLT